MKDINQIWGPYLAELQHDGNIEKLHYIVKNNRVSPYLEIQADNLYGNRYDGKISKLDVNPYVRFFTVFEPLLTPDDLGYEEFNQALSDIILHYLANLDLKLGMCRQDFYVAFVVKDLEDGAFGGLDELKFFTRLEKCEIARWILCFYNTGEGVFCLSEAVKKLIPTCEIFIREAEEYVFHMREPLNEVSNKKLLFLIRLFLPMNVEYTIHWINTYGVVGYKETMLLGDFVLA